MTHQNNYKLVRPCADCPFRTDRPFYLTPGRVSEIERSTKVFPFSCHNTVDESKDETHENSHCAGALILLEKIGRPSLVMRLAESLGLYDPKALDMEAPVYSSWDEMRLDKTDSERR